MFLDLYRPQRWKYSLSSSLIHFWIKNSNIKWKIIKIHYYKQSVKTRFLLSTNPLPLQCNACFLDSEIERGEARRDVRWRVLDFRSISIRARRLARYWRRKKYRTSFRLAVSVQRPALKRPVPETAACVHPSACDAQYRFFSRCDEWKSAASGIAWDHWWTFTDWKK